MGDWQASSSVGVLRRAGLVYPASAKLGERPVG